MTEKSKQLYQPQDTNQTKFCLLPERAAGHFCSSVDPGIEVDMEIQAGDPVDSQIIRNFMGEFERVWKDRSA